LCKVKEPYFYSKSMSGEFHTCKECDFEWHQKDGSDCPVCSSKNDGEFDDYHRLGGGMFDTGQGAQRMKLYYQGIGLVALVYFLYLIFGT
jgi:hypothetical protein